MTLSLLAQAVPDAATPTTIVGAFIFVALSLVALVGWLLRNVFITTIPSLLLTNSETVKQITGTHETTVKTMTDAATSKHMALLVEQKSQRESHEKNLVDLCKVFREESAAERQQCAQQFAAVNASLISLVAAQGEERTAIVAAVNEHTTNQAAQYRHDLYDRLNEAVLGKELAAAKRAEAARNNPTERG